MNITDFYKDDWSPLISISNISFLKFIHNSGHIYFVYKYIKAAYWLTIIKITMIIKKSTTNIFLGLILFISIILMIFLTLVAIHKLNYLHWFYEQWNIIFVAHSLTKMNNSYLFKRMTKYFKLFLRAKTWKKLYKTYFQSNEN
jgi:hypothetical protein